MADEKPKLINPYKVFIGAFIPNFVLKRGDLTNLSKLCYGRLLQYAGKNGYCFPKQSSLAEELACSENGVQLALKELVAKSLLFVETPKGKERLQHRSNKYYFILPDIETEEMTDEGLIVEPKELVSGDHDEWVPGDSGQLVPSSEENHIKENQDRQIPSESTRTNLPVRAPGGNGENKGAKRLSVREALRNGAQIQGTSLDETPRKTMSIPLDVKKALEFWNNSGLRQHKKETTKTYQQAVCDLKKLFNGSLFKNSDVPELCKRAYSLEELTTAVKHFADYIKDSASMRDSARKMVMSFSISDFLYNPFAKKERRSAFLEYLHEKPPPLANRTQRKIAEFNPNLTKRFILLYEKTLGGAVKPTYTDVQMNKFISGANLLSTFYDKQKGRGTVLYGSVFDWADFLYEALIKFKGGEGSIEIGNFCSTYTFEKLLPSHLFKIGALRGSNEHVVQHKNNSDMLPSSILYG